MISREEKIAFYEKSLDKVNYWLQFAETKHAALIAFVIAALAIIYGENSVTDVVYRTILSAGYATSLAISMFSFAPIYKFDVTAKSGDYLEKDNIIFWGDIYKYTLSDYMKKVAKDIFESSSSNYSKEEVFLAEEIIINSRIANRKYKLFRYSLIIAIFFTILLPVFLIIIA